MKLLVVGLGSMGKRRIRLLKAIHAEAMIYGVDFQESRREEAGKLLDILCYPSIEEALQEQKLECAFICTAPLSHAKLIETCLKHRLHVFTEINLVSVNYGANISLAAEKNKILFLSSTPIYRDEMRKIKKVVKSSKPPFLYNYHVGQYLPDWHPWEDYSQFFVGDKRTNGCREILAIELPWLIKTFGKIKDVHVAATKCSALNINYNDYYSVQMIHENNTIGNFIVDVICRQPVRKLEVFNEEIYLEWQGRPDTLKSKNLLTGEMEVIGESNYIQEKGYSEFVNEIAYINELEEFFAVVKGKTPEYTFEEDLLTLALIDRIEGRVV